MTVTIYRMALTRAGRCLWAAEELGIDYTHVATNMFAGEHKSPEFLAINPNGKLPAMVDGDLTLFESMAINLYLAAQYGQGGLACADAKEVALAEQWSVWVMTACETPLLHALLHAMGIMGFEQDAGKVKEKREEMDAQIAVLNGALEGKQYLLGDRFTVADLNVSGVFQWGQAAQMDWAPYTNVAAWIERCFGRPSFGRVAAMVEADVAKMNG